MIHTTLHVLGVIISFLVAGFGIFWAVHLAMLVQIDEEFDKLRLVLLVIATLMISASLFLARVPL